MLQFPPFGGALDVGRARPRASNAAIPPVWWRPRRGVSSTARLSWCNFSRLLPVSSESRSRPGSPALSGPLGVRRNFGDGGFAPLEASSRRVAGLSRLKCCNSPRLAAVRLWFEVAWSRFGVVWRPKCRPPRRKTPIMGCRGRGGLRFGQNCLGHGVLFAREPAIACANRLYRTSTRYSVSGRGCPRSHQRVNVRISGPTLALAGPGADERAHVRVRGPRLEFVGPRTEAGAAAGRTQTEAGTGG